MEGGKDRWREQGRKEGREGATVEALLIEIR